MRSDFGNRYLKSSMRKQFLPKRKRLFEVRRLKNLELRLRGLKLARLLRQTKLDAERAQRIASRSCRSL